MYYILYNPTSSDGKAIKKITKLFNDLSKLDDCYKLNIFEILGKEIIFLKSLTKEDIIYLCGGDGTLNHFLNSVDEEEFECQIFFYSCGNGNDFKRDYKHEKFVNLAETRKHISKCYLNGNEKHYFANGIGIGIDSQVCRSKNQFSFTGSRKNYFGLTFSSFKKFRPFNLNIEIDGELHTYNNVWTMICNNGKYIGGGMKICPDAVRDDGEFDLVIIHDISRFKIKLLFPLIYLGLHRFVKGVECFKCKTIKAIPDGCNIIQLDGETLDYAREIKVE